jgi:hypothetical protein
MEGKYLKNTINGILLFLLAVCVFPQNQKEYNDFPFKTVVFNGQNVDLYVLDPVTDKENQQTGQFQLMFEHNVPFINIDWGNKNDKYLMLSNELICFFYVQDGYPVFTGYSESVMRKDGVLLVPYSIKASSSLKENSSHFTPDLTNTKIGEAWVEGVSGQGVHEKLFIRQPDCTALHISIGFVSFTKPYLYQENSRPKKIRVFCKNKFTFDVDLADTPNFQTVVLPQALGVSDELIIEIVDVYPGTKYEDTCINSILYDIVPMVKRGN